MNTSTTLVHVNESLLAHRGWYSCDRCSRAHGMHLATGTACSILPPSTAIQRRRWHCGLGFPRILNHGRDVEAAWALLNIAGAEKFHGQTAPSHCGQQQQLRQVRLQLGQALGEELWLTAANKFLRRQFRQLGAGKLAPEALVQAKERAVAFVNLPCGAFIAKHLHRVRLSHKGQAHRSSARKAICRYYAARHAPQSPHARRLL